MESVHWVPSEEASLPARVAAASSVESDWVIHSIIPSLPAAVSSIAAVSFMEIVCTMLSEVASLPAAASRVKDASFLESVHLTFSEVASLPGAAGSRFAAVSAMECVQGLFSEVARSMVPTVSSME